MFAVSFLSVESKVVGPIGPSTVRSIKRLVRFSRKPLSSVAPRSEFAVWRQVAASFVPRLGLSLRELSKFTISPRFPSLAHSRLSTGTSPSNGPFGPASAAARSNDPRPYVCRLVPECSGPIYVFATRALSSDLRWSSSSIYVFGLDTYGNTLFSGGPGSQGYGFIASELNDDLDGPFGGRDVVGVGDAFGESFLYYSMLNPATGMVQRKVAFVKRIVSYGLPILVGSGYYLDDEMPEQETRRPICGPIPNSACPMPPP